LRKISLSVADVEAHSRSAFLPVASPTPHSRLRRDCDVIDFRGFLLEPAEFALAGLEAGGRVVGPVNFGGSS
jgi:hypothetical protein